MTPQEISDHPPPEIFIPEWIIDEKPLAQIMQRLDEMNITIILITLFGIGTILFGFQDCWKNEHLSKKAKIIYSIVILVPFIGLGLYYRDKERFQDNNRRLTRQHNRNPWDM